MSSDRRAERRCARARDDLRAGHRAAHALVSAHDGAAWRVAGAGWSPAEIGLHLALHAEVVARRILDALAVGARAEDPSSPLVQQAALRIALLTWRLPLGMAAFPGTDPAGLIVTPEGVKRRLAAATAELERILAARPAALLAHLRAPHPRFGELDVFEWIRYLRIHVRHHELRLETA